MSDLPIHQNDIAYREGYQDGYQARTVEVAQQLKDAGFTLERYEGKQLCGYTVDEAMLILEILHEPATNIIRGQEHKNKDI